MTQKDTRVRVFVQMVDPDYLDIFTVKFLVGSRESAFSGAQSIVITNRMARRMFGRDDPIGKQLTLESPRMAGTFTVTGVVQDHNGRSSFPLHFDILTTTLAGQYPREYWNAWRIDSSWQPMFGFVLLREGASRDRVQRLGNQILARNAGDNPSSYSLHIQPLSDIRLRSEPDYGISTGGDIRTVYLLSTVSALLWFVGCLNYAGMSTARSIGRSKEIGTRKTFGATRAGIGAQFIVETFVLVACYENSPVLLM